MVKIECNLDEINEKVYIIIENEYSIGIGYINDYENYKKMNLVLIFVEGFVKYTKIKILSDKEHATNSQSLVFFISIFLQLHLLLLFNV